MHIRIVIYQISDYICYKEATERKFGWILAILIENNIEKLKIQCLLIYNELPEKFCNTTRQQRSHEGAFWLLNRDEYRAIILLEPQAIISSIAIGQKDTDGYIVEILYKHDNRWKLRPASLNYKHLSEYAAIELFQDKDVLPIYKLFLDIYYDDFSTYRNVYHSLGGVYLQFGNMLFDI